MNERRVECQVRIVHQSTRPTCHGTESMTFILLVAALLLALLLLKPTKTSGLIVFPSSSIFGSKGFGG